MDPTDVMNKRIPAFLIDLAILASVLLVSGLSFGFQETTQLIEAETLCDVRTDGFCLPSVEGAYTVDHRGWITIAAVPALWFLWAVLEGVTGASPGKWTMGLRVVTRDGSLAGIGRSLVRWAVGLVESFPFVTPMMLGVLFAANAPGRQRLGDRLANTFVVTKDAVGQPLPSDDAMSPIRAWPSAATSTPPPPTLASASGLAGQHPAPPFATPPVAAPPVAEPPVAVPVPEPAPVPALPAGVRWDQSAGYYVFEDRTRRLWWDATANQWMPLP